jgi:hypothetical protein
MSPCRGPYTTCPCPSILRSPSSGGGGDPEFREQLTVRGETKLGVFYEVAADGNGDSGELLSVFSLAVYLAELVRSVQALAGRTGMVQQ